MRLAATIGAVYALGIGASYLLAMAGEPQSVWLWGLFGVRP